MSVGLMICLLLAVIGCGVSSSHPPEQSTLATEPEVEVVTEPDWETYPDGDPFFYLEQCPSESGFDYPVGPPDAKGYYNAQKFQENNHLGDDWNGVGGGNTDLGDAVYAMGSGVVFFAQDLGMGWGNIVRVVHVYTSGDVSLQVESLYAHLDSIGVEEGQILKRGEQLGTIGTADGSYYAHLHFEIRDSLGLPVGGGYDYDTIGYRDPTAFIRANRPGSAP